MCDFGGKKLLIIVVWVASCLGGKLVVMMAAAAEIGLHICFPTLARLCRRHPLAVAGVAEALSARPFSLPDTNTSCVIYYAPDGGRRCRFLVPSGSICSSWPCPRCECSRAPMASWAREMCSQLAVFCGEPLAGAVALQSVRHDE